jgi:hypothetical protein
MTANSNVKTGAAVSTAATAVEPSVRYFAGLGLSGSSKCPLEKLQNVDVFGDCRYATVCPSPCSPLYRLGMRLKKETADHDSK